MTTDDLIERVMDAVGRPADEAERQRLRAAVMVNIETGLDVLADRIAADRARRADLRPASPFALVVAGGEADLSELIAAPNRMLLKYLRHADVRDHETGERLHYLARDRYDQPQPAPYSYFTVEARTLRARLKGEAAGESNFDADLSANFVPTLDEVGDETATDLVMIVAALVAPKPEQKKRERRREE